jgi:hypothetical protein
VLLPLYEFVDIGEHWPNDGNVVLVILSALYIIGVSVLCRGWARICAQAVQRVWLPGPQPTHAPCRPWAIDPHASALFLIFCLFRI